MSDIEPTGSETGRSTAGIPCAFRRNLVCVRLASPSVFESWFRPDAPRSWDLLLSHYRAPTLTGLGAEIVSIGGASKFSALKDLAEQNPGLFDRYDHILCLDDDLLFAHEDIDRFFGIAGGHDIDLGQPALTPDSHYTWDISVAQDDVGLRLTDFVEVMMPAFSRAAFRVCLPTFDASISSYGLDEVWTHLLQQQGLRMGIVDAVRAVHTRQIDPANGAFYNYLRSLGIDPQEERRVVWERYGFRPTHPRTLQTLPLHELVEAPPPDLHGGADTQLPA